MGFFYLASPYTSYRYGREAAAFQVSFVAAYLMTKGVKLFCPIAHSHAIAEAGDLDHIDHDFWIQNDRPLMEAAKGLIVCQLPGWQESRGVQAEIACFQAAGKPIVYWNPLSAVPEELL